MFGMAAPLKRCTIEQIKIIFMQEVVTYAQTTSVGPWTTDVDWGKFDRHAERSEQGEGVWTIEIFFVKNVSGGSLNDGVESKRAQAVLPSQVGVQSERNSTGPLSEKKISFDLVKSRKPCT